ncbi:MAG: ferrous iron transport protein A [Clostridiales bacterium]|jgi:ferrous iron transport protein A|nr:ferrous iron transport protein A [Clostridiales bacterium]
METTLSKAAIGSVCRVKRLTAEGKTRRRLFDMGITVGAEIYVRKAAPLGDPLEVTLRGYELTLRKAEAEFVVVEVSA